MKQWAFATAAIPVLVVVVAFVFARFAESYQFPRKLRRQWKDKAVAEISRLTADLS